jgi:hypothetical protein
MENKSHFHFFRGYTKSRRLDAKGAIPHRVRIYFALNTYMKIQLKIFHVESWLICLSPVIEIRTDVLRQITLIKHTVTARFICPEKFNIGQRKTFYITPQTTLVQWKDFRHDDYEDF